LSNVVSDGGPIPSPTDSALQAARGGGDRGTLRVSSVARFGSADGRGTSSTLTLSAEHAALREESAWSLDSHERPGAPPVVQRPMVRWQSNTGLLGQLNTSIGNDFFLTGGVRLERNDALLGDESHVATLPMLGASYVHDVGALSIKLRSAYGKGIRAPRTPSRSLAQFGSSYAALAQSLTPERQSGVEGGLDVFYNRRVSLHLTRFDQTASGLIQQVVIFDTTVASSYFGRRITYELQNVGKITNRGWEMQGTTALGPVVLAGSLSLVDSRVVQLATGYSGDLRPGDRMLGVPSRTASAMATWARPQWSASLGATRAWDWVNYDRITLGEAVATGAHSMHDFVGTRLRSYWMDYDGATRLRATAFREIARGFGVTLAGDNLLNRQTGEPDNATIVPGRTITVGVKAKF
jgi:iron complex outermembrane receptor protein